MMHSFLPASPIITRPSQRTLQVVGGGLGRAPWQAAVSR